MKLIVIKKGMTHYQPQISEDVGNYVFEVHVHVLLNIYIT